MSSPTRHTLDECRKRGWLPCVVERWIPGKNVRVDVWGFGDVLVLDGQPGALLIQATTASNASSRIRKIVNECADKAAAWLLACNRIEVWATVKRGRRWRILATEIVLDLDGSLVTDSARGPFVNCGCGCGRRFPLRDAKGKRRRNYVFGHQQREPLAERFWDAVDVRSADECWEWQRSCNDKGYGQIEENGAHDRKNWRAHRLSWELKHGPIPEGMCVCHRCDNPPCVNPTHLFLGTRADNTADMVSKGRMRHLRGEEAPRSRLRECDVHEIRRRAASGESQLQMARSFGVSKGCIAAVIHRRTWRHI